MPSVITLDGPRGIGAIAIPLHPAARSQLLGLGAGPIRTDGRDLIEYGAHRTSLLGNLGAAVATGFGEISSGTKTGLLALGVLGLVGLAFYHGNETARRRGRALFGSRRRRRRR